MPQQAPYNATIMNSCAQNTEFRFRPPETLLVVEDDEDIRALEVRALSRVGYTVLHAPGAKQALRMAAASPAIDLLLTDFQMPQANGLELARRFRVLHPKAPVLMVSGALREVEGRTGGLERVAFLAKPFSWQELVEKVKALLAGQRGGAFRATVSSPTVASRALTPAGGRNSGENRLNHEQMAPREFATLRVSELSDRHHLL